MAKRSKKRFYRINRHIRAPEVRVIDKEGKQIGIMPTPRALEEARKEGLDLVEVAPKVQPPVCKLLNFRDFLYQLKKKSRVGKRGGKAGGVKEIRLKPFVSDHDLEVKLKRMEEFLSKGDKIKVTIRFRRRELRRKEFGIKLLKRVFDYFGDKVKMDQEPKFRGGQYFATFALKANHAKTKNTKVGG